MSTFLSLDPVNIVYSQEDIKYKTENYESESEPSSGAEVLT